MHRLLIALVLASGCSSDLPPASVIEKLRVLAVQADPPEVAPGQTTALSVLAVEPPVQQLDGAPPSAKSYVWLACTVPSGVAQQVPCGVGGAQPLPGAATGQATMPPFCKDAPNASLCVIGTDATGTFTPSASALGGERTTQMLVSVTVADTPEGAVGCLLSTANNDGMPTDPDHCVLSLKRLVVTDPQKPLSDGSLPVFNHNPQLDDVTFVVPDSGASASLLEPGAALFLPAPAKDVGPDELHAVRAADAAEIKPTFDSSGNVTGSSYESLTVAWFITGGKLDGGRSAYLPLDPNCATQQDCPLEPPSNDASTKWTAPTADALPGVSTDGSITFYAVIRDDRGGVSWRIGSARTP